MTATGQEPSTAPVLAIDTATEALVVGLSAAAGSISHVAEHGLQHGARLAPLIHDLAAQLDLDLGELRLIAVGIGPGSFTGVRIGLATALGIAAGTAARVVGVSGLDAWGHGRACMPGLVVPVIDARKRRFYAALYRDGVRLGDYLDLQPEALADHIESVRHDREPVLLTGRATGQVAAALASRPPEPTGWRFDQHSRACDPYILAALARQLAASLPADAPPPAPLYLRRSEAEIGIRSPQGR